MTDFELYQCVDSNVDRIGESRIAYWEFVPPILRSKLYMGVRMKIQRNVNMIPEQLFLQFRAEI
jgi:hypothetical protein